MITYAHFQFDWQPHISWEMHRNERNMKIQIKKQLIQIGLLYTPDLWSLRTVAHFMRLVVSTCSSTVVTRGCAEQAQFRSHSVFLWLRFWSVFQWSGTWETVRFRYPGRTLSPEPIHWSAGSRIQPRASPSFKRSCGARPRTGVRRLLREHLDLRL